MSASPDYPGRIKRRPPLGTIDPADVIGNRYGTLIVLSDGGTDKYRTRRVIVACDCGHRKPTRLPRLIQGKVVCKYCAARARVDRGQEFLVGAKIGTRTVVGHAARVFGGQRAYNLVCECGKRSAVRPRDLHQGCLSCVKKTHGESGVTAEFRTWIAILQRCGNKYSRSYPNYGGRGIRVCDRWRSYENFLADMGRRPAGNYSIDRYPDNDGNYEPANCRWATVIEQSNNRRTNLRLVVDGRTKTATEWAREYNVSYSALRSAIKRDPERAIDIIRSAASAGMVQR